MHKIFKMRRIRLCLIDDVNSVLITYSIIKCWPLLNCRKPKTQPPLCINPEQRCKLPNRIRKLIDRDRCADRNIACKINLFTPSSIFLNTKSLEMLVVDMAGLRRHDISEEAHIKLKWQLRTITAILEQLYEHNIHG